MTRLNREAPPTRSGALPTTVLGRCAGALLVLLLALLAWIVVGINSGALERGSLSAQALGVTMLGSGAASLLCAVVARIRAHDRSWVVIAAIVVPGLVLLVFGADLVGNALSGA